MSGGHWNYLSHRILDRVGVPLEDMWKLLAAIEHELDWGICCDTCYDCAKIRTVNALEAYFDTEATSIENSMRLLHSSEPECAQCKEVQAKRATPPEKQPRESATIDIWHEGKRYKGVVYMVEEDK